LAGINAGADLRDCFKAFGLDLMVPEIETGNRDFEISEYFIKGEDGSGSINGMNHKFFSLMGDPSEEKASFYIFDQVVFNAEETDQAFDEPDEAGMFQEFLHDINVLIEIGVFGSGDVGEGIVFPAGDIAFGNPFGFEDGLRDQTEFDLDLETRMPGTADTRLRR